MTVKHTPKRCRKCDFLLCSGNTKITDVPAGVRRHAGRGLCSVCYAHAVGKGAREDYPPLTRRRSEVLEDYAELRAQGCELEEAAQRMRMSPAALDRALHRARAAGELVPA